ncbi:phosphate butyryltransferase, partial [Ruminococcaceae bacterium OttesenSCG-928-O06]|nr:phosphate butyryltransferase [Ruminococcaceae bacterium OttesenSCG-928-O06]
LLCPDIAAANILYKSMKLFGGFKSGGVLMGGTSPIIFTSRSDDAETKLNTIAFCVYLAQKA